MMPTIEELLAELDANGPPKSYPPSGPPSAAPGTALAFEDQRYTVAPGQSYAPSGSPSAAPGYAVAAAPFDDQRELQGYMTAPRTGQSIAERRQQLLDLGLSGRQVVARLAHEGLIDQRYGELAMMHSPEVGR
jgi:hypothetical protein